MKKRYNVYVYETNNQTGRQNSHDVKLKHKNNACDQTTRRSAMYSQWPQKALGIHVFPRIPTYRLEKTIISNSLSYISRYSHMGILSAEDDFAEQTVFPSGNTWEYRLLQTVWDQSACDVNC